MGGTNKVGWCLRLAVNQLPKWQEVRFRPSPTKMQGNNMNAIPTPPVELMFDGTMNLIS